MDRYRYGLGQFGRSGDRSPSSLAADPAAALGQRGLVAHAAWVPPLGSGKHQLAIWAEAQTKLSATRRRVAPAAPARRPRPHPFAAKCDELIPALQQLWKVARPGVRPRTASTPARLTLWVPARGTRPLPSPELIRMGWARDPTLSDAERVEAPLALWRADALLLDAEAAGTLLAGLPYRPSTSALTDDAPYDDAALPRLLLGDDLRLWSAAAKLALSLLERQHFLPGAIALEAQAYSGNYLSGPGVAGFWFASLHDPADRARFEALAAAMPDLCRAVVTPGVQDPHAEWVPNASALLEDFLHHVVSAQIAQWMKRDGIELTLPRPPGERSPYGMFAYGYPPSSLAARWLSGLMAPARPLYTAAREVRSLLEGTQTWHARLGGAGRAAFRLCLRLTPPDGSADHDSTSAGDDGGARAETQPGAGNPEVGSQTPAESDGMPGGIVALDADLAMLDDAGLWQLEYLLQARDEPSLLVPLAEVWRERGAAASFLDRRFEHPHEAVLASLGRAARLFAPIERSLRQPRPTGCELTGGEAYAFLRDVAPALEEVDFGVLMPPWWKRTQVKPSLRLGLRAGKKTSTGLMGLEAVVGYDWKLALGGAELTRADLERLAALKEPLIRVRGRWVEVHRDQVDAALRFVRSHATGEMSLGEALRASLTGVAGDDQVEVEEVAADEWIGDLLGRLRGGETMAEVAQPTGLCGTLRPYQVRGLGWLAFLARYGLGACLADDMGLGKTIMLLALLLHRKAAGLLTRPVLLVCPTSVVGNWRHEAARFAPELRVLIHHGIGRAGRAGAERFAAHVSGYDLVVTTYSLLPRDEATLVGVAWDAVVLDEAQNIKNVDAKQSRAARKLRAPVRIALTGTPVENRLSELWSIMDFLNGGYLGSHNRFHEQFAYPIEKLRDPQATTRLQALVRPFMLRRLKADPAVIRDLPQKIEMREYCSLTREQVTLYEAVVRDGLRQVEEAESPMRRRAIVLGLLVKLKQVCNHPAHLLGDGSALAGRSGKLIRLEELIEELLAEGDRALIFTQFTAMGNRLQPYLQERFDTEVLYLHGGVPRQRRERLLERFQADDGPPLFLLSLKAGGTGLNLTHANHVIHFDRWWNPAVENQATDRAFRIGQTRNVQVRKFVCSGTLEERIDMMIEQKRELAENVIGAGEQWLTEMSATQLREIFSLRADALAE